MGDVTIAQDLLDGVADALADLGDTRTFRIITAGAIDPNDPGAEPSETTENVSVEAILFNFDERYMPGANVLEGGLLALLSIKDFTAAQVGALEPGNFLIDGTTVYTIVRDQPIEAAGIVVTAILQLRG